MVSGWSNVKTDPDRDAKSREWAKRGLATQRAATVQRMGYLGEKICQDAHQGAFEKMLLHKHMTECPAADCKFISAMGRQGAMKHIKQVMSWTVQS